MKPNIRGPIIFKKFVKNMTGYNNSKTDNVAKKTRIQAIPHYSFRYTVDKAKYRTFLMGFHTQTSLKMTSIQKSRTEACKVLNNHAGKTQNNVHEENNTKGAKN
jgi:hypothetical protein